MVGDVVPASGILIACSPGCEVGGRIGRIKPPLLDLKNNETVVVCHHHCGALCVIS
jgi:hypothetical protein